MVKNLHQLACKFDLDQSELKSLQFNASACLARAFKSFVIYCWLFKLHFMFLLTYLI